jgi:hypothetical protein
MVRALLFKYEAAAYNNRLLIILDCKYSLVRLSRMAKHTASVVLAFDPKGRQSSRRSSAPAQPNDRELALAFAHQKVEKRRLAKALDVTDATLMANGARLYNHGAAVAAVEAGYRTGAANGRDALLAALNEYHDLGYESGLGDGAIRRRG